MIRPIIFLALSTLFVLGCGPEAPPKSGYPQRASPRNPSDKISIVPDDDERMNDAMIKARATVNTFLSAMKSPSQNMSMFSIKVHFKDGTKDEHMWISGVVFDGTHFHGVIANDPQLVKNFKAGQKVSVPINEISDWMFLQDNKLVGGETLRVVRNAYTGEDRTEFDKSLPFVID